MKPHAERPSARRFGKHRLQRIEEPRVNTPGTKASRALARLKKIRAKVADRRKGAGKKRKPRPQLTNRRRAERRSTMAIFCAETGVPNTGRQWRKLRKAMAREERGIAAKGRA